MPIRYPTVIRRCNMAITTARVIFKFLTLPYRVDYVLHVAFNVSGSPINFIVCSIEIQSFRHAVAVKIDYMFPPEKAAETLGSNKNPWGVSAPTWSRTWATYLLT